MPYIIDVDVRESFQEQIDEVKELVDDIPLSMDKFVTSMMLQNRESQLRERFGVLIGVVDGFDSHVDEELWLGDINLNDEDKQALAWYYILIQEQSNEIVRNPNKTAWLNDYEIRE